MGKFGNLFKNLLINDLKNRYSGSLLGLMWTVIHPLASFFIYYFVFSAILKVKLGFDYSEVNFSLWLFCGLLPWLFFSETVIRSTSSVLENANLVTKTIFPSQVVPVVISVSSFINHIIALIIFMIGLFWVGGQGITNIILLPLYLVPLILYTIGISWITASLNVFLRDIGQVIGVLINIWFYLTPIIYPINSAPEEIKVYLNWNPMMPIVEGYRQLFFKGEMIDLNTYIWDTLGGLMVFILGYFVFMKLKKSFADVL
jgi:ABC-type polysaccharide/polyol phosphate export permease